MKKTIFILLIIFSNAYAFENIKTVQKDNSVALTFDACGGTVDFRILNFIKENKIPVTLFVTGIWLDKNPNAIAFIKENKEFFNIENHGLQHKEAIENDIGVYNLATVKNEAGLNKEVEQEALKIEEVFGIKSKWYRTAGAMYDLKSKNWLLNNKWKIGGYTIAADEGATASREKIIQNLKRVKSGDVILMHINKPNSHVYDGFVQGYIEMKKNNIKFKFLN
jgi:peptidoglycan/xylan/chitin deacetylase (PgdA/CDA1 family)